MKLFQRDKRREQRKTERHRDDEREQRYFYDRRLKKEKVKGKYSRLIRILNTNIQYIGNFCVETFH